MKRTQIYLTTEQWRDLAELSKKEHRSVAELIREAVDQVYRVKTKKDSKAAVRAAAGIWADRTDLASTEEYVRRLRRDTRATRLGLKR